MRNVNRLSIVLIVMVLFGVIAMGCAQKSFVIDRTGMSEEHSRLVDWKVQHAQALDWYQYTLTSLKANLEMLPKDEAREIYKKIKPVLKSTRLAIDSIKVGYTARDPEQAAEAYEDYMRLKAKLISLLLKL